MIAKISHGWRVGGLLHYLMGAGRFNEHTNQHVVASWDGAPARHQPPQLPNDEFDVSALTDRLTDPAVAGGVSLTPSLRPDGRVPKGPVWHCSLRNHSSDRVLSDAEWAQVVEDVMDRTGIARRGDLGGCRWVAIRHADDHVHIAAVLVRQDNGKRVHPRNDYARAAEACRAAESKWGLTSTAPSDRTQNQQTTRAETEKAARRGANEPSRVWLRRAARVAAVQARDPQQFFTRLTNLGVVVQPRTDAAGAVVGYSVAAPGDVNEQGLPIWFSGRTLAKDLSLPKLLARWSSAPPPAPPIPPTPQERADVGAAEREAAIAEATSAAEHAAAALAAGEPLDRPRSATGSRDTTGPQDTTGTQDTTGPQDTGTGQSAPGARAGGQADHGMESELGDATLRSEDGPDGGAAGDDAAGIAHAASDLVTAVCSVTERGSGGGLVGLAGNAAEVFDRAARQARVGQPSRFGPVANELRTAAWRLMAVRRIGGRMSRDPGMAELMLALAALVAEIAAYHEQTQCLAQAAAARRAAAALRTHTSPRPPANPSTNRGPGGRGPGRDAAGAPAADPRRRGGAVPPNGPATPPSSGKVGTGSPVPGTAPGTPPPPAAPGVDRQRGRRRGP